jgi:hypothetical protein
MTEKEWLKSKEPKKLLAALGRKPSKRKRRLFGCACCRRVWQLIPDERCRTAVITAEQFADDVAGDEDLTKARVRAKTAEEQQGPDYTGSWAARACYCVALANAGDAAKVWQSAVVAQQMQTLAVRGISFRPSPKYSATMTEVWNQEVPVQAALLRDIFGNPFRPVSLDLSWLTTDVLALARGIYDERAFDRMPILADALQDAGCDNDEVLFHCRDANPIHVRGCWVLDLILGKT